MVCVFGVLDNLHNQEPVHKGGWIGKLAPAHDWVLEVWTKQCGFEVIHIPAKTGHKIISSRNTTLANQWDGVTNRSGFGGRVGVAGEGEWG